MTVALVIGGDGARWVARGGLKSGYSVERSWVRIPSARFRILGKFVRSLLKSLGMLLVYPKRMAVGIKPKEGEGNLTKKRVSKMASCFVLVNNSSCATIRYVAVQSLNHSRQVAAFQKYQHLKISTLASCPLRTLCTNT